MRTIPIEKLEQWGTNAPINVFADLDQYEPQPGRAFRLQKQVPPGAPLDALVVDKGSEVLVVSLHGAFHRHKIIPPRFERLAMLLEHDVSSAYFADPSLHLDPDIQLTWFTGGAEHDVHADVAAESARIATKIGARHIVFTGSSGGGFACLQISALLDGSSAVAFNAQTDIPNYRASARYYGPQRDYVRVVWPRIWSQLQPPGIVETGEWSHGLDDRVSALRRYSVKRNNRVFLVQNSREFHAKDHEMPFLSVARAAGNDVTAWPTEEGENHDPPYRHHWHAAIKRAVDEVVADRHGTAE